MNCQTVWCYNFINPFIARRGRAKNVYVCSPPCQRRRHNYKKYANHTYKRKQLGNRTCLIKDCEGIVYWYEQYTTKFCNDCKHLTPRERKNKIKKKNIVKHGSTIKCKMCENEFTVYTNCQYYCSKKCFYIEKMEKNRVYAEKTRADKGNLYFYLTENDKFYKFGVTSNHLIRLQAHKSQGIHEVFTVQDEYWKVRDLERLIKRFTKENNLRFTGTYNFKNAGRTETICKSKMDNPKAKWIVKLIKSKRDKVGQ